MLQFIS